MRTAPQPRPETPDPGAINAQNKAQVCSRFSHKLSNQSPFPLPNPLAEGSRDSDISTLVFPTGTDDILGRSLSVGKSWTLAP